MKHGDKGFGTTRLLLVYGGTFYGVTWYYVYAWKNSQVVSYVSLCIFMYICM